MINTSKKISIIGAGPAGCYTAYLLAKKGFQVSVYEEHEKIGKPIQCGGLLTDSIKKVDSIFKNESFIVNKLPKARVFSENNLVDFKFKRAELVVDRSKFDSYIAKKAERAGARFFLGAHFVSFQEKADKIEFRYRKNNKIFQEGTDILIGADGVFSKVAEQLGIEHKKALAIQAKAKFKKIPKDKHVTWFNSSMSRNFFAWLIPESFNIGRIGLGVYKKNEKQAFLQFKKLLKIHKARIIEMQSGYVPIDRPKKSQFGNIYLVGDAACHVKASTGGGIITGLKASKILAESIINNQNYDKELKKLNKQLYLHYLIRKGLDKFDDNNYNQLVEILKKQRINNLLETVPRDELEAKHLLIAPELMKFARKFI